MFIYGIFRLRIVCFITEREDMSTTTNSEKLAGIRVGDLEPPHISPDLGLTVFVLFTSIHWTLKALERAREIARPLGASIVVVAVQVVPYPLPLSAPPVPFDFVVKRFEEKTGELSGEVQISAFLCRDLMEGLKCALNRNSPVVIGTPKGWLPTRDERMARKLLRAGYEVILVDEE